MKRPDQDIRDEGRLFLPSLSRRGFLAGLAAFSTNAWAGGAEQHVPNSTGSASPTLDAPVNACDCHHHIYDRTVCGVTALAARLSSRRNGA